MNWVLPFELFGYLEQAGFTSPDEIHLFGFSYVWHGLRDMINHLNQTLEGVISTRSRPSFSARRTWPPST